MRRQVLAACTTRNAPRPSPGGDPAVSTRTPPRARWQKAPAACSDRLRAPPIFPIQTSRSSANTPQEDKAGRRRHFPRASRSIIVQLSLYEEWEFAPVGLTTPLTPAGISLVDKASAPLRA